MSKPTSPFTCSAVSVTTFPDERVHEELTIRVEGTGPVYITLDGSTPSAANAKYMVKTGEALEICADLINFDNQVKIIGDATVYWSAR